MRIASAALGLGIALGGLFAMAQKHDAEAPKRNIDLYANIFSLSERIAWVARRLDSLSVSASGSTSDARVDCGEYYRWVKELSRLMALATELPLSKEAKVLANTLVAQHAERLMRTCRDPANRAPASEISTFHSHILDALEDCPAMVGRAWEFYRLGELTEATKLGEVALMASGGDSLEARFLAGLCYVRSGQFWEGAYYITTSSLPEPGSKNVGPALVLARQFLQSQRYTEGLRLCRIALQPGIPESPDRNWLEAALQAAERSAQEITQVLGQIPPLKR